MAPLDVLLGETDVYQPDVMFVANARRPIITDHGLEGAPDLVVEILSPVTARVDKGAKRKVYARSGVRELWLVDPERRTIAVHPPDRGAEQPVATHDVQAVFESAVLPGLRIEAATVLAPLRPA